jgi:hypothetical protein
MKKFAIYKFVFSKSPEGRSVFGNQQIYAFEKAQEVMESMLQVGKLNIYRTKGDGDVMNYPNHVFRNLGGVTMMRVCNVKYLKRYKEFREIIDESEPWCDVVVDNRAGICQMAIEKSNAFDGNTDKVRDLLREALERQLAEYGIDISITAKVRTSQFWDFVNEQCDTYHDVIKKMYLEIPNPRYEGPIDSSRRLVNRMEVMSSIVAGFGAHRGIFALEGNKTHPILPEQMTEDAAEIMTACCSNGYSIVVNFRDMGVCRNHDVMQATYNMTEKVIQDFIDGVTVMKDGSDECTFELAQWLDKVREKTKDYENGKSTAKRG